MSTRDQEEFAFDDDVREVEPGEAAATVPPVPSGRRPDNDGPEPLRTMMDRHFLDYAAYVIRDRAIPNIEDGLKPVQRRILFSLHERDDGRFVKVANIVGHTMQYHPHGDASIGDALVALTNRGYLIEGQGNFGNALTGDPAAAPRYIECRLTDLARTELFNDDLTDMVPSYDGRRKEPVTLPCKLPLLLLLGAEGIAVGLSTRIFPHNFVELLEAQVAILSKKSFRVWPDFPQGGLMDVSEYSGGVGKIRTRARIAVRADGKLVINELPFGTTTESLIASIEDATRKKKVPVKSIDDFTAESAAIELTLTADADPQRAIQALFAFTDCETSVSGKVVVIRANKPVEWTIEDILKENTQQLVALLKRELTHRRAQCLEEQQAKTLVQLFVEERLYQRIEECKTYPAVQDAVRTGLEPFRSRLLRDVTEQDIEMLLQIRIRRISRFDIDRNRREIEAIVAEVKQIDKDLAQLVRYAIRYLRALLKKYGERYPRRTEIAHFSAIAVRDLTAEELVINHDTEKGYLGHAVNGEPILRCSSYDKLMLVWNDGLYRVVPPPDKFFVDRHLIYSAKYERDRVITVIYQYDEFTFLKRFRFGGCIMNKEYHLVPEGSRILLLSADDPPEIFVKYKPAKHQRIHQAVFRTAEVSIQSVKARGNQLTAKAIARIAVQKPKWWNDQESTPRGVLLDV